MVISFHTMIWNISATNSPFTNTNPSENDTPSREQRQSSSAWKPKRDLTQILGYRTCSEGNDFIAFSPCFGGWCQLSPEKNKKCPWQVFWWRTHSKWKDFIVLSLSLLWCKSSFAATSGRWLARCKYNCFIPTVEFARVVVCAAKYPGGKSQQWVL